MVIQLRVFGSLQNYLGGERLEIELPRGGTVRDLLNLIDDRWGHALPSEFWDAATSRFRGPVMMMTHGKDIPDEEMALSDGQEILLLMPLAGG